MSTKKTKTNSAAKKTASKKASAPAAKAKPAAKKPAAKSKAKTAPAKNPVTKKKPTARKSVADKTSSSAKKKSTAAKKKAAQKTVAAKNPAKKNPVPRNIPLPRGKSPAPRSAPLNGSFPDEPVKPKVKPMNKRDLKKFKKILLDLRDRLQGDIRFLTTDNLHRAGRETGADLSGAAQHSADHGTDNFDREFALSLASAEQDVMYEVDEALMRITEGTYGICELTGVLIEPARLEVIPYTRYSVQAQAKMEQSRPGYRPFGQSFKRW